MGERETQLEEDYGDVGISVDPMADPATEPEATSKGLTGRLRARGASLFSARAFLLATVACLGGFLVLGGLIPLGSIANLLGIAVGGFLLGTVATRRRYVESAVAGAAVGGGAALLDHLVLALFGLGLPLVALGAIAGLVSATIGHYLGRDLRAGLTADL